MKPFDFINDVSYGKQDLIRNSENPDLAEKIYSAFLTNRAFSFHLDTILHANEMNMFSGLDNIMQHDYLLNSLPKRKRFGWVKKDEDQLVSDLCDLLQCSAVKAKEYAHVLGKEIISELLKNHDTGGVKKNERTRKTAAS